MGIIQKQGIRSSIHIFIGYILGAVNMMVLFPLFFSQSEIGLTRAMIEISLTLATLCNLGTIVVINKYYSFYESYLKKEENDLPFITGVICIIGFLLVLIAGSVYKDFIVRKLGKSPEFVHYFYTIYPFTFFMLLFVWLEAFAWGIKKTSVSNFLKETVIRVVTTILILLYGFKVINLTVFINLFSLTYIPSSIALIIYLVRSGKWNIYTFRISKLTRRLKKKLISFGAFVYGSQFLHVFARTNDTILMVGLRGLADTGVFTIAMYITTFMEIPQRSLTSISVPVLAESWKDKNMANIEHIYRKSVSNLLVIGLGMFFVIWLNMHNVVIFLNHLNVSTNYDYSKITMVVLIMGIAKVIDLGTGVNGQIIYTSNYWKFDFYTNVFYTVLSIPMNFVLIKHFGLIGLAISNLGALTLYNLVRYIFLWAKFGLQPYTFRHLLILLSAVGIAFLTYHIPQLPNWFADAIVRGLVFVPLFVLMVFVTKAAPDMIGLLTGRVKKLSYLVAKRRG